MIYRDSSQVKIKLDKIQVGVYSAPRDDTQLLKQ